MGMLDYPRHFLLLGAGAAALAIMTWPALPVARRPFLLLGAAAALHAMAVVLALRSRPSWPAGLAFVAAAAAASLAASLGALALVGLVRLDLGTAALVTLALASAVGAALYWLLLRGWRAPSLTSRHLLLTVSACVAATFIGALALGRVPVPRDVLLPVLWWLAFSACLRVADRSPGA